MIKQPLSLFSQKYWKQNNIKTNATNNNNKTNNDNQIMKTATEIMRKLEHLYHTSIFANFVDKEKFFDL